MYLRQIWKCLTSRFLGQISENPFALYRSHFQFNHHEFWSFGVFVLLPWTDLKWNISCQKVGHWLKFTEKNIRSKDRNPIVMEIIISALRRSLIPKQATNGRHGSCR